MSSNDLAEARNEMVRGQIAARGIRDKRVLNAMKVVRRELFLPDELRDFAYEDKPLSIGEDQTISQPYMVALMVESLGLDSGKKVLEIGTGSGYAAAVLSQIAGEVFTVERIPSLARSAARTLKTLDCQNVRVLCRDGTLGLPDFAPFDAIVVAAGAVRIPPALQSQLGSGGRLVLPVGTSSRNQKLIRITRTCDSDSEYQTDFIANVRFVPLVEGD